MEIVEVQPDTEQFEHVLAVARSVLAQDRYITATFPQAERVRLLGAFDADNCCGFLLYLVQPIGADCDRPPVVVDNQPLREGYVEAFGVLPEHRRRGIGEALQAHAIEACRQIGCYQMRSRSPMTSTENYALKLKMGYAIQPSAENDSYYFLRLL